MNSRARFARPLKFGTAGLRGPVRGGPDAMNVAVVLRATWAVAQVLRDRGLAGATGGRRARRPARLGGIRHARRPKCLPPQGFSVLLLPGPVPTPVVAFAVRHTGAAAGIQITASHNPPADNGYKVYFDGGIQIISPTDRQIEAAMAAAPPADQIAASRPVATRRPDLVDRYIDRAAGVRRSTGSVRVALTPLHGVGGAVAVETLRRAGFGDVHAVAAQFAPDPDFPTVAFPNPEEPGATDALLALAADVGADVAIALDPDADRCAVGIPDPAPGWRMLSGDETGWLLGDYILSQTRRHRRSRRAWPAPWCRRGCWRRSPRTTARSTSRLSPASNGWRAPTRGPRGTLVYAYEEAIGHCVDPAAVRDKDGISAAVLVCDLVATLKRQGRSVPDALDELARRYGVHDVAAVSRRVADADEAADADAAAARGPADRLAGLPADRRPISPTR